ncbi:hypothetical protein Gohar_026143, partial [Gossypium harknessii]|nr:hypothetical protein [Gossypium harknessii]
MVSNGEELRWLPMCHHCFHAHCIDAWLEVSPTCPICRVNVAPNRSFIISSMVSLAKRVGEWIENPLSSELTVAFCERSPTVSELLFAYDSFLFFQAFEVDAEAEAEAEAE